MMEFEGFGICATEIRGNARYGSLIDATKKLKSDRKIVDSDKKLLQIENPS